MRILLNPQGREDALSVAKVGNVLTVNGEEFDFTPMTEGSTLPREAIGSMWFDGPVEKVNGEITLTLILPNPWNYSPEQAFPVTLENIQDGDIQLPKPLPVSEEQIAEHFDSVMALMEQTNE